MDAGAEVAQGEGHAAVPGGRAGNLGGVVGDDDALEIVVLQDAQDAQGVHVAVIDERFLVSWDFAPDVAEVDVGEFVSASVTIDVLVDVAFGHFGQGADAELQRVARRGVKVQEFLEEVGLIDKARLAAHRGRGRIIRMGGEGDAAFFGNRDDRVEKVLGALPKLIRRR